MAQERKKVANVGARPTVKKGGAASRRAVKAKQMEFLLKRENFKWMLIGVGIVAWGMILMLGGGQSAPDVWEPEVIYSARRVIWAPIVILVGLLVEVYAIFLDDSK